MPITGLLTRREACQVLRMSLRRFDELVKSGEICAVQDGKRVKFRPEHLQDYIDGLPSYEPSA